MTRHFAFSCARDTWVRWLSGNRYKTMYLLTLFVICLTTSCWADVPGDEIKALPGLNKQPFWKHYSGYLQASGTRKLHYWFVESASDNPSKDPVVLWLNGGPGCSSLLGLLTENGPFRILPDGKTVVYNPHSWNNIANVLFLEAPAGVGFSYSKDKKYYFNDDQVASDNHLALKDFFSKFPEYKANDFYVTGESYGGVYVPTLSILALDDEEINFKGFAVGNGISSWKKNSNSQMYFYYYHGLIGERAWGNVVIYCCNGNSTQCDFSGASSQPKCENAMEAAEQGFEGSDLNPYNLYGECLGEKPGTTYDPSTDTYVTTDFEWTVTMFPKARRDMEKLRMLPSAQVRSAIPCLNETSITVYLNSADVRKAIHIPDSVQKWDTCSSEVGMHYKTIYKDMSAQYLKVLGAKKRVVVYNGDVDTVCNFLGDEWFVDALNQEGGEDRKPWFYIAADGTKQNAGFVKPYGNLTFVTVRGSGHMVPTDRPEPALVMFTNFIKNKPY